MLDEVDICWMRCSLPGNLILNWKTTKIIYLCIQHGNQLRNNPTSCGDATKSGKWPFVSDHEDEDLFDFI